MTVEHVTRIGLGTAQLGMDYGVTNRFGLPSREEAQAILHCAAAYGVDVIDTAASYGGSEQVLGELLPAEHNFRIITKTVPVDHAHVTADDAARVRAGFRTSLERLQRSSIAGLLVHHAGDLLAPGGERLWNVLQELRAEGLVNKIGVSVYTGAEIDAILGRFEIDLIQLPLNVFDQRLVNSGHLLALHDWGVEVHARSVFLQGVLLSQPGGLPQHLRPLHRPLAEFTQFCREDGLTALQAALAFVLQQGVDRVIVGACREDEFREVLDAAQALPADTFDFAAFACDDEPLINPARWVA